MPSPQATQIHIDQALTNFSQAFLNEEYVGNQVVPMVPVKKRSDVWFVYGKENFRYRDLRRMPSGLANDFNYTLTTSSFMAQERTERHLILDDNEMEQDAPLNEQIDATQMITDNIQAAIEYEIATYVTNTANLTQNTALAGTAQWSDYANSTPLTNLKAAKVGVRFGVMKRANTFVSPYDVSLVLADHPQIKDLIKYTDPKSLNESGLPGIVRGLRVIEPSSVYDSAVEGRAFSGASIWGKNAIVMYLNPTPTLKSVSLAYMFAAPDSTTGATGFATRTYRSEERKGTYVEVSITYVIKTVAPLSGYLFGTCIA